MTETRIRWEPVEGGVDGYVGAVIPPVFTIHCAGLSYADWMLTSELPGDARPGNDLDVLKAWAEEWLEEFVSSLGAVFPEPGFEFDDDDGEPLEVKYAPGRRVRYIHPDYGYPGDGEQASRLLTVGEVYVIDWSDIGFSKTRLSLAGIDSHGQGFNSVLFEPADDEPAKEAGQ